MNSRPSNEALWPLPPNVLGTERVLVAAVAIVADEIRIAAKAAGGERSEREGKEPGGIAVAFMERTIRTHARRVRYRSRQLVTFLRQRRSRPQGRVARRSREHGQRARSRPRSRRVLA